MIKVAVIFGGVSPEHEVSVVSALQAIKSLDSSKYQVVPVYWSKSGQLYSNSNFLRLTKYANLDTLLIKSTPIVFANTNKGPQLLKSGIFKQNISFDIALPILHGSFGEDGSLQGLFESLQIPYCGFNVTGSAVSMDKVIAKALFKSLNIPVGKYVYFTRHEWQKNPANCLKQLHSLKYPLFVKPADGGSTIGINKADNLDQLKFHIEVAATYSDKILIEEGFTDCVEINCAAVGYQEVTPSVCEMPIKTTDALSYEDKYLRGGKNKSGSKSAGMASLSRQIPAPISAKLTKQIQDTTVKVFQSLEGCGVARIDYFVDPKTEKFWINEINSPPGSLAFYLFEPIGLSYPQLLDRIIADGFARFKEAAKTQTTFASPLLQQMAKASS